MFLWRTVTVCGSAGPQPSAARRPLGRAPSIRPARP